MPMYRKTALVDAEQFLPPHSIPTGCYQRGTVADVSAGHGEWMLKTLEGEHGLRGGDYICTGPAGEKWNVERSIFEATYELADALQAMTASPREVRLGVWRPISELADLYQQPLMIASPELIHGDKNPLGISEAFWQDDAGDYIGKPGEGAWRCVDYDMCNDEFQTLHLAQDAVSHFLIPEGPWTVEEARALEWDDSARTALGDG